MPSESSFRVHGPAIGASAPFVDINLSGTDYDGTLYFTDSSGNEYTIQSRRLSKLREDGLIIRGSNVSVVDSQVWAIFDELEKIKSQGNPPAAAREKINESSKTLFRAVSDYV